eukprot:m.167228 g.167228  ORF g.167228 m.167228 type:complete len:285 (+) comp18187_c0_seq2:406-1260(+)
MQFAFGWQRATLSVTRTEFRSCAAHLTNLWNARCTQELSMSTATSNVPINEALARVHERVAVAVAKRCQKSDTRPRVVAVSKTKPMEAILEAYAAGQRVFGENYIQELVTKATDARAPSDIEWHFIGTLQSNKAKLVASVPNLKVVETITSKKQARLLDKALEDAGKPEPLRVFVQVNTSGETAKGGVHPDDCVALVRYVAEECPHLQFSGVMAIGQYGRVTVDGEQNPDFALLVRCHETVCNELKLEHSNVEISMGMSGDFEHAIELGATNVRVGSTIFGARE